MVENLIIRFFNFFLFRLSRQKRTGTADQELFHLAEKMRHFQTPLSGIRDLDRM